MADLFHRWAAQVVSQFRVPDQNDRQIATTSRDHLHQTFEPDQSLSMTIMGSSTNNATGLPERATSF